MKKLNAPPETDIVLHPVPEVPIAINEPVISDDEVAEAIKRQGGITIPKKAITDLAAIGAHVMGAGILKVQRGQVIISQQRLNQVMLLLMAELTRLNAGSDRNKTTKMVQISQSIGYLTARLTDAQSLMVSIERIQHPSGSIADEIPASNVCFPANEAVKPQVLPKEVHFHQHNHPPAAAQDSPPKP